MGKSNHQRSLPGMDFEAEEPSGSTRPEIAQPETAQPETAQSEIAQPTIDSNSTPPPESLAGKSPASTSAGAILDAASKAEPAVAPAAAGKNSEAAVLERMRQKRQKQLGK